MDSKQFILLWIEPRKKLLQPCLTQEKRKKKTHEFPILPSQEGHDVGMDQMVWIVVSQTVVKISPLDRKVPG